MIVDINEWSWLKSRDHFFVFCNLGGFDVLGNAAFCLDGGVGIPDILGRKQM